MSNYSVFKADEAHGKSIYDAIRAAEQYDYFTTVHRVDPAAGEVEGLTGDLSGGELEDAVEYVEGKGIVWPGVDYERQFHASEFFEADNWKWNVEGFVEDGQPFYVQTVPIEELVETSRDDYSDVGEDDDFTPELEPREVGWALLVRVETSEERERWDDAHMGATEKTPTPKPAAVAKPKAGE